MNEHLNETILNLNVDGDNIDLDKLYSQLPESVKSHSLRVALYGNIIYKKALKMGVYKEDKDLNEEYAKYIIDAFRYHDIGKVLVPLRVLYKTEKYDNVEFALMRKHAENAGEIFGRLMKKFDDLPEYQKNFLYVASEAALSHHERWDGKGYPGNEYADVTNIIARVCALADAYDAITTPKQYKVGYSHEYACEEIRKNKGTQFDPILVEVFEECREDLKAANLYFKSMEKSDSAIESVEEKKNIEIEGITQEMFSTAELAKDAKKRERKSSPNYNPNLFKEEEELRPIELLYDKVLECELGEVAFINTYMIINDNKEGTLFPENYIDVASRSNRIEKLTKWNLKEIEKIHESWEIKFEREIRFIVYLNRRIIENPDKFVGFIRFLSRSKITPKNVAFRISAKELFECDRVITKKSIEVLRRKLGYMVILDEYDADFNPLDLFLDFDFDCLIVDMEMYKDNGTVLDKTGPLVRRLTEMGRDLDIDLMFKGITSLDEIKLLKKNGVIYMNGKIFGTIQRRVTRNFFKTAKFAT